MIKTEDIKQIQFSIWGIYKDFLSDKNLDRCRERMDAMMQDFEGSAQYFLASLIYSWSSVAGGLAEDFADGRETGKRTEGIARIQNTTWKIFQSYLSDHDMAEYNRRYLRLAGECRDTGDRLLADFFIDIAVSWAPVATAYAESFRKK